MTRDDLDQIRGPFRQAEDGALDAVPAATGLDLTDDLCGPTSCSTKQGDVWIYRDGGHLSVAGATALTPDSRTPSAPPWDPRPDAAGPRRTAIP